MDLWSGFFSGMQTKHFPMEEKMKRKEKYLESERLLFFSFKPLPQP